MMRLLLLSLLLSLSTHSLAQDWSPERLQEGGYIIYFRHAEADLGKDCKDASIPEWWKSTEPERTRQLTDRGKHQAQSLGAALVRHSIPVERVISSEFRRAQQTAKLMTFSMKQPMETSSELTPLVYQGELAERLKSLLTSRPKTGFNTVLVAHGHILPGFDIDEGDALIFEPGLSEVRRVGKIRYNTWLQSSGGLRFEDTNPRNSYELKAGTVIVTSATGIGTVVLRKPEGGWPELRRVRFLYSSGQGMKVLEGLRLRADETAPRHQYSKLRPKLTDGALQLDLPPELPDSTDYLQIHWVDFYR